MGDACDLFAPALWCRRVQRGHSHKGNTVKDKKARHDIETLTLQMHELVRRYDQLLKAVVRMKGGNPDEIANQVVASPAPQTIETKRHRNDPPRVGKTIRSRTRWSDDEIALLCLLREQGAQWAEIATIFKRTKKACMCQYSFLQKTGQVANVAE